MINPNMKNILTTILLTISLNNFATSNPKLYKIQYVGTTIIAYTDVQPNYDGRTDIIIYKLFKGKYVKI